MNSVSKPGGCVLRAGQFGGSLANSVNVWAGSTNTRRAFPLSRARLRVYLIRHRKRVHYHCPTNGGQWLSHGDWDRVWVDCTAGGVWRRYALTGWNAK